MHDRNERFWAGRRVFMTGCTGFLGSWLADELLELDARVVGLVRDASAPGARERDDRCTLVNGCLEDQETLERAINEHEIDTVFHLGAQAIVGVANRDPLSTFEANIRGTYNLLESCRRAGTVTRVVVSSSDLAYGAQPTLPLVETMFLSGNHPYDVSKSCADLIAQTYHNTYGLPVCITRCGNAFGGRDLNFNRIVPGVIRWGLRGERPIIRSDGKYVRDYIYVRDIANAYLTLAHRMDDPSIHGHAFNFGMDTRVSVHDLTERILSLMDRADLRPIVLNEASREVRNGYLSSVKARKLLDWMPRYTLDEGLAETIQWYRAYFAEAGTGEEPAGAAAPALAARLRRR